MLFMLLSVGIIAGVGMICIIGIHDMFGNNVMIELSLMLMLLVMGLARSCPVRLQEEYELVGCVQVLTIGAGSSICINVDGFSLT